jgi:Carboxypeptidase regulatory-like domain/TonB dependent receptor
VKYFGTNTIRSLVVAAILIFGSLARAQSGQGSISGTIKDATGSVIPASLITLRNGDTQVERTAQTDAGGFYVFPSVPVGQYEIEIAAAGFKPYKRTGLTINVDTKLQEDISLEVGGPTQKVIVTDTAIRVETADTQIGEVVTGSEIVGVALNGRSYTDLLALQPGVVPMSTQTPDSVVMAGATVAINPSGALNPGNQSISGQREDANGFLVNGGDVKELMNGGTLIIPDLDSISEFRILTDNFDAEYGNYSGGIINVVTKSGTNQLHGSVFEFVRNTALDAKNFFSPSVEPYIQNQFGGTLGGPIKKSKLFFFGDYQGTRTTDGLSTGDIPVPTVSERSGNLLGVASLFETGCNGGPCTVSPCNVAGTCLATQLSNSLSSAVGAPVTVSPGENYYVAGCTTYAQCVFPNGVFPMGAWSSPAQHLLQYIPQPNVGDSIFSTGSEAETVRDDKFSVRFDGGNTRWGQLTVYYFYDNYKVNDPFPREQGGSSVPGFGALNIGKAQLISLGDSKAIGSSGVNEAHVGYMRTYNNVGQPSGAVGQSLASQGFVTGGGTQGIVPLDPSIEGPENMIFNSFVVGEPITNLTQENNAFTVSDDFSKVVGKHTIKAGFQGILDQINIHPDPEFNGGFTFSGSETGSDFVDFLVGAPNLYNQADSQSYYPRHKYIGGYGQDSWQIAPNFTLNYGVRWELMEYWSEKYNQIPTFIPGEQSRVYPTAPVSFVYPGDKGVPNTLVPHRNRFSPRLGLAYSPSKLDGWLGKILGRPRQTSIRAGYGIYHSVIQGNSIAFDEPQPPYGLSYTSPAPPLFATPFTNATGETNTNPFPLTFVPYGASVSHPISNINYSQYLPIAGMTAPPPTNTYPYTEQYFLSIERELSTNTVLQLNYVGSEAHHLLVVYSANPGDPALCLTLPGCGPGGENTTYVTSSGQTVNCTRVALGCDYGNDSYEGSIGNSNYNSFQASLRHTGRGLNLTVGYTYSKSIDQSSSLADVVDPYNFRLTRALSAFNLKQNLVVTYQYTLPLESLFRRSNRLTQGWELSGITRASTGFPVTLSSDDDNSLQGSNPNGVNNRYFDLPDVMPGSLEINHHPANGKPYFNTALFTPNALGTPGDAKRRYFSGPGTFDTDLALLKSVRISEGKAVQLRMEAFNVFNHSQFFGPSSVNGDISSPLFGQVVQASPPRLLQLAAKFTF